MFTSHTRSVNGVAALCAAAAAAFGALAPTAEGAAKPFRLAFEGVQRPATFPSVGELQHEGRFTASAPFCAAGYGVDVRQVFRLPLTAIRRLTCGDGSGGVTVRVDRFPAEHEAGGSGAWRIVQGTGRYAGLRGTGTWTTTSTSGDRQRPDTVGFHGEWRGVVDFDATAPTITVTRASAERVAATGRAYRLDVAFSARDDAAGARVTFAVAVRARGRRLASWHGASRASGLALALRVDAPRHAANVAVEIVAADQVGNRRTVRRSVRLGAGGTRRLAEVRTLAALEPQTLARARVIRTQTNARYGRLPGRRLAVTEATSTGSVGSLTLFDDLTELPRVVPTDNGIYYAICPARAHCPSPARFASWPAAAPLPQRQALELAVRTFLETSASLVVVSLPTQEPLWAVFEREDLLAGDDGNALRARLAAHPAGADRLLQETVDRLVRPRLFQPIPTLPPSLETILAVSVFAR